MSPETVLATSDPPLETFSFEGAPLTFVDEGPRAAPVMFALHGIPGSVRDFRYLAPALSDALRLVRVDLPGFGGSAPRQDAIDGLDGRTRAVLALADHLQIASFAALGHSMGGGTALLLAAQHPARVNALLLLASVALRSHLSRSPQSFRRIGRALGWPMLGPMLVPQLRATYARLRFPGAEGMTAAAFSLQMRAIGAVDFARFRAAAALAPARTLLAFARDDHMLPAAISEELVRAIPHARVLAFPDGGHNIQKTKACELAAAIKPFLA